MKPSHVIFHKDIIHVVLHGNDRWIQTVQTEWRCPNYVRHLQETSNCPDAANESNHIKRTKHICVVRHNVYNSDCVWMIIPPSVQCLINNVKNKTYDNLISQWSVGDVYISNSTFFIHVTPFQPVLFSVGWMWFTSTAAVTPSAAQHSSEETWRCRLNFPATVCCVQFELF